MANAQKMKKGLPKRTSNAHAKEARQRSWKRGQERKRLRQEENHAAFERNQRLRSQGLLTPWELAKQLARARKADRQHASTTHR